MKSNSCFSVTQPLLANKSIKFAFVSHLTLYIIFLSVVQTLLYPNLFLASLNSLILILVELSVIVIPFPFTLFVGKYCFLSLYLTNLRIMGLFFILVWNTYFMCAIIISGRNFQIDFFFYLLYNYFICFFVLILLYTM